MDDSAKKSVETTCLCASLADLAAVPMGGDGLDERVFATLDIVQDHGGRLWWLYLSRCSACGQNWLVAQEERIYDEYFLRRLDIEQAARIEADGLWPDDFITYERVLRTGRGLGNPCIYLDARSPALVETAKELREECPGITTEEIAHLLGMRPKQAERLLRPRRFFGLLRN